MHVTLRFLGNLDPEQLRSLQEKLTNVEFDPFELTVGPLGYFPGRGAQLIRVLWAKASGAELLQGEVDRNLGDEFPPEERHKIQMQTGQYSHHITLCRVKRLEEDSSTCFQALDDSPLNGTPASILVNSFVLMESTLSRHGATYTPLVRFLCKK